MTSSTRRNGFRKFGPLFRQDNDENGVLADDGTAVCQEGTAYEEDTAYGFPEPATDGGNARHYTGRHSSRRDKTTRKRVGRVVPVAAVAATLAAGTAAYVLVSGQPQAAHLNSAMSALPGTVTVTSGSGAGNANAAGTAPIKTAVATARATAKPSVKASPSHKPASKPAPVATHAAQAESTTVAAAQAAAPAPSATASSPATTANTTAAMLSCNQGYGMLPDNVTAIVSFLLAHGYSNNAAAGIAGNIYQESKGNPESIGSGGGGLIGWTPLPAGFVTGNVSADLQTQLTQLLTYNQGWAQYLPALNAAASPADAASIYVTDFERAGIPAASTREASASNVAAACGI